MPTHSITPFLDPTRLVGYEESCQGKTIILKHKRVLLKCNKMRKIGDITPKRFWLLFVAALIIVVVVFVFMI
jgi:hypothetical protein